MSYQVYGRIIIGEKDSGQRCDSSVYAAYVYADCDDDTSKVLFCDSPIGYWVCHK
jgi:hypothetical protein